MNNMYNWLYFQYVYMYLSVVISGVVYYLYSSMNGKAEEKEMEKTERNKNLQNKENTKNDNELK